MVAPLRSMSSVTSKFGAAAPARLSAAVLWWSSTVTLCAEWCAEVLVVAGSQSGLTLDPDPDRDTYCKLQETLPAMRDPVFRTCTVLER